MQSKVHVSRSNRAFLSPPRENGSGSRTEKGAPGKGVLVVRGGCTGGQGRVCRWSGEGVKVVS